MTRTNNGRGEAWESEIETANDWYRRRKIADVRKVPHNWSLISYSEYFRVKQKLPGSFLARTEDGKFLVRAKSDVDFIGGGRLSDDSRFSVCFDCKDTRGDRFPLSNLADHQLTKMLDRARCGWHAGVMLRFSEHDRAFFVPADVLDAAVCRMIALRRRTAVRGTASLTLTEVASLATEIKRDKATGIWNWISAIDVIRITAKTS